MVEEEGNSVSWLGCQNDEGGERERLARESERAMEIRLWKKFHASSLSRTAAALKVSLFNPRHPSLLQERGTLSHMTSQYLCARGNSLLLDSLAKDVLKLKNEDIGMEEVTNHSNEHNH